MGGSILDKGNSMSKGMEAWQSMLRQRAPGGPRWGRVGEVVKTEAGPTDKGQSVNDLVCYANWQGLYPVGNSSMTWNLSELVCKATLSHNILSEISVLKISACQLGHPFHWSSESKGFLLSVAS